MDQTPQSSRDGSRGVLRTRSRSSKVVGPSAEGRCTRRAAIGWLIRRVFSGSSVVALFSPMAYGPPMAMLPKMLEDDRRLAGWLVGQTASAARREPRDNSGWSLEAYRWIGAPRVDER